MLKTNADMTSEEEEAWARGSEAATCGRDKHGAKAFRHSVVFAEKPVLMRHHHVLHRSIMIGTVNIAIEAVFVEYEPSSRPGAFRMSFHLLSSNCRQHSTPRIAASNLPGFSKSFLQPPCPKIHITHMLTETQVSPAIR